MLSLNGDRQNVTIFLTLSIILIAIGQSQGAEMINHSSSSPTSLISNQNSLRSNDESISNKLTQIRHLLKSLFFDWNSGERESEVKGKVRNINFDIFILWSHDRNDNRNRYKLNFSCYHKKIEVLLYSNKDLIKVLEAGTQIFSLNRRLSTSLGLALEKLALKQISKIWNSNQEKRKRRSRKEPTLTHLFDGQWQTTLF